MPRIGLGVETVEFSKRMNDRGHFRVIENPRPTRPIVPARVPKNHAFRAFRGDRSDDPGLRTLP